MEKVVSVLSADRIFGEVVSFLRSNPRDLGYTREELIENVEGCTNSYPSRRALQADPAVSVTGKGGGARYSYCGDAQSADKKEEQQPRRRRRRQQQEQPEPQEKRQTAQAQQPGAGGIAASTWSAGGAKGIPCPMCPPGSGKLKGHRGRHITAKTLAKNRKNEQQEQEQEEEEEEQQQEEEQEQEGEEERTGAGRPRR